MVGERERLVVKCFERWFRVILVNFERSWWRRGVFGGGEERGRRTCG